jgi:plastocyanin
MRLLNSETLVDEAVVTLTSSGFEPKELTIKVGQKVVWKNESGGTASVNSGPHPVHTAYPPLNLGNFDDGETLNLVFDKKGSFSYHNHLNPSQTGKIKVE